MFSVAWLSKSVNSNYYSIFKALNLHLKTDSGCSKNINYQMSNCATYRFRDIVRTRFERSRSQQVGQRSNQGHTMTLHTYTPQSMSLPSISSNTLEFPRYSPDKLLPAAQPPAHPDTIGENNTHTALKGCGVIKLTDLKSHLNWKYTDVYFYISTFACKS